MKGENNMEGKFLPIGSVVRLKDGQKRLMITGAWSNFMLKALCIRLMLKL